ncbi:hypothetical protein [Terrisporobacter sp.]|uniref:hypothetical protein n=1 Tax=Terrisporobacter sp. TaxID=1965305 RepID=UPI0026019420|nr:hypothetical protein [Terrisporobacter sp.]
MSNEVNYSRFFGGSGFNFGGWLLPLLVIFILFSFGDDLLEFIFCEDSALIWIIILVVLFMFIGEDDGCCC